MPALIFQLLDALEFAEVEQLALQRTKEALHCGNVQVVPLAGHTLHEPASLQSLLEGRHSVLPALVGTQ